MDLWHVWEIWCSCVPKVRFSYFWPFLINMVFLCPQSILLFTDFDPFWEMWCSCVPMFFRLISFSDFWPLFEKYGAHVSPKSFSWRNTRFGRERPILKSWAPQWRGSSIHDLYIRTWIAIPYLGAGDKKLSPSNWIYYIVFRSAGSQNQFLKDVNFYSARPVPIGKHL